MKVTDVFESDITWLGKLNLNFSLKQGRSVLSKHSHVGPFFVQRSFYLDDDYVTPHIYLLHPPGGLVGGDQLILSVQLDPYSKALITTPGLTKFYKTNRKFALQNNIFRLSNNSVLEWIPQGSIFFPESRVKINTVFQLEQEARIISYEMLCFNYFKETINTYPDEIDIFLHIALPISIGLRDRLKLNALNFLNKLSGFKVIAFLFAVPADEILLKQVRNVIRSIKNIQIGGATLLDELLVVRILGHDSQKIKFLFYDIWNVIRPSIIGKKAIAPRIWFT